MSFKDWIKALKWYFLFLISPVIVSIVAFFNDTNQNEVDITDAAIIIALLTSVALPAIPTLFDKFGTKIDSIAQNLIRTSKRVVPRVESSQQFQEIFSRIVKKASKDGTQTMVIAVDNLDRCEDEAVVEMLGTIKSFMNIPGCVFVVACDDEAIIN